VAPTGPGERAVLLPWFWPDAASFHALAGAPDSVPWSTVRSDPGLLFFIISRDIPFAAESAIRVGETDLRSAAALLADRDAPWTDWRDPGILPATRTALAAARFAELLAGVVGGIDPARAWAGAWLAYAGWLAVGVVDPRAVADCLSAPTLPLDPFGAQLRTWGMSRADIAWRLANAWPMPRWARVTLGRLDGTPEDAHQFGGDRRLQAVVQTAAVLAEQAECRLYVADEFDLAAALAELRAQSAHLDYVRERYSATAEADGWLDHDWADPRTEPGLADRLLGAAHGRPRAPRAEPAGRRGDLSVVAGGESGPPHAERAAYGDDDSPVLQADSFAVRVRDAKLAAVAEFAAGASHEINNPLAVISGQSQYLLKQEMDDGRKKALQSIVRQTRRIHAILTELMYFARPPAPQPEWVELGRLVREAAAVVRPLADERRVQVQLGGVTGPLWVDVDPRQLTMALSALIRNGVEAVPAGGWVRVSTAFRPDRLEVVIDDSGPGPDEQSQAHLFDPFYSGRAAGRGRGLGLPAAWRLAREHGGDVRYVPVPGGPTRFVLSLPSTAVVTGAQRKSA
jgi:signal transduction histidine kinase